MAVIGLILIGAISFWIVYAKGYQAASENYAADRGASVASAEDKKECLAKATIEEAVECSYRARSATTEQQQSAYDLNAQREMSNWAESTMWATWLVGSATVIVAALGAWWVRDTLVETRNAVKAANDAVAETRRIGEAQVRAYLSVTAAPIPAIPYADTVQTFEIEIKNNGQSAARNVRVVAIAEMAMIDFTEPCPDQVRMKGTFVGGYSIAPGESVASICESRITVRDAYSGPIEGFEPNLIGIVWYEDVFRRQQKTRFSYRIQRVAVTSDIPKPEDKVTLQLRLEATHGHNDET